MVLKFGLPFLPLRGSLRPTKYTMRVFDIVSEEYVHRVNIDIKNLARNMAAARFASEHGQGLNYADSLVYLGLLGDPSLEIVLKPKAIGAYYQKRHRQERGDDQIHQAFKTSSPTATTLGIYGWGVHPERDRARNNLSQQQYDLYRDKDVEYDLFVSVEDGENLEDLVTAQPNTIANLAHELRHRAFQLTNYIPALKGQLPHYRITDSTGHVSDPNSIYYMQKVSQRAGARHNMYVEHGMIYSVERRYDKDFISLYDSLEQIRAYQELYKETEAFIRSWLDRNQNSHRAWQDLVNYIDQKTPGTGTARIDKDKNGELVIINREPATNANKPAPTKAEPATPTRPPSRPEGPPTNTDARPSPTSTQNSPLAQTKPQMPSIQDGPVGWGLSLLGVNKQLRNNQQFVDRTLGPGYRAGSKESNIALLKKLRPQYGK